MASTFVEDFEGGSDGTGLSTSNTGFTFVETPLPVFKNTPVHSGSLSARFSVSSNLSYVKKDFTSGSTFVTRFYVYITSYPTSDLVFMQTRATSSNRHQVQLLTTGALRMRNGVTTVYTMSNVIPLNEWVRIEWKVVNNTGQTLRLFTGANVDTTTALEDSGSQTANSGTMNNALYGITGVNTATFFVDGLAHDDADWIGPLSSSTPKSGSDSASGVDSGVVTSRTFTSADTATAAETADTGIVAKSGTDTASGVDSGAKSVIGGGTNLLASAGCNTSFDVDASDWTAFVATLNRITSSPTPHDGAGALRITTGETGGYDSAQTSVGAAASAGSTYTASIWVYSSTGVPQPYLYFVYSTTADMTGYLSDSSAYGTTTTTNAWVRLVVTAVAPASTAYIGLRLGFGYSGQVGDLLYLDSAQLESGSSATDYNEGGGGTEDKAGTDTASGVDSGAVTSRTFTATDTATVADAATSSATASTTDSAAASDSASLVAGVSTADTATAVETSSIGVTLTASDVVSAVDAGSVGATQSTADTAAVAELAAVVAAPSTADVASSTDLASVATTSADAGSAADVASLLGSPSTGDTGLAAEVAQLDITSFDAGSTADAATLEVATSTADAGTSSEAETLFADVAATDAASTVDVSSTGNPVVVFDDAAALDATSIDAVLSTADVAGSSDAGTVTAEVPATESATSSEAAALAASTADLVAGVDVASVEASTGDADSAAGSETWSLSVQTTEDVSAVDDADNGLISVDKSVSDSASTSETVRVAQAVGDAASSVDSDTGLVLSVADIAVAVEFAVLLAQLTSTETVSIVDAASVVVFLYGDDIAGAQDIAALVAQIAVTELASTADVLSTTASVFVNEVVATIDAASPNADGVEIGLFTNSDFVGGFTLSTEEASFSSVAIGGRFS